MNKELTKKDIRWLVISNIVVLLISLIFKSSFLLTVVSLTGINYSYLIAKVLKIGYILGFISFSLYAVHLLINNIYALGLYNLLYAVPMTCFGYYFWSRKKNKDKINEIGNYFRILILVLVIFSIYVLYIILNVFGGTVPFFDALSAVLCTLGTLLMSMKYKEQWSIWIIANFVNIVIWIIFSISDISNISILTMWIVYFINSIYGYYNWNKQ